MIQRIFTPARKAQGFRDQAHLDGFFRYYDHTNSCSECQKPGSAYPLDDGMQPTRNICDEGRRLLVASW